MSNYKIGKARTLEEVKTIAEQDFDFAPEPPMNICHRVAIIIRREAKRFAAIVAERRPVQA
jgi:hypothetical protein